MYFYCYVYSYCSLCSVLYILFHCVILCIVCESMCTVLLLPSVNPIAINKYMSISIESIVVEIRCESVEWIHLTQGRVERLCLVNTIMALTVP